MKDLVLQSRAIAVNKQISDVIQKETSWLMFDSWGTNVNVLDNTFYVDKYHYPGTLTKLSWNIILSGLCS